MFDPSLAEDLGSDADVVTAFRSRLVATVQKFARPLVERPTEVGR